MNKFKVILISALTFFVISAFAQNKEEIRTISIQGYGEVSVKPDVANISFNLSTTNLKFKEAVDELNSKVNSLTKALKKVGIPKDEIFSSNYNINKEYQHNYKTGVKTFLGYKVSHSITLQTGADTKSVNKVFEAIIKSLNDVELNLSFGIKDPEKSKDLMITKAIEDAKLKANMMAEASGVNLLEILSINYSSRPIHFRTNSNAMYMSKKMTMDAAPVMVENFNPANIKQNTSVSIVWKIE